MQELLSTNEPDWNTPLSFTLTPGLLINTLFSTASTVHTAWSSCVDNALALADLVALDEASGNYCRLVEQEYMEDDAEEVLWHDWAVELRIGNVLITGHWQIEASAPPMEWEWCSREAEKAFEKTCTLLGKRLCRVLGVEDPQSDNQPPKSRRH